MDLLKKEVPKQTLSIEVEPKSLTKTEKEYVVQALLSGNIEMVKTKANDNEEAYVMMRKFGLMLLRDIMQDNDSLVRRVAFEPCTALMHQHQCSYRSSQREIQHAGAVHQ